MTRQLNGWNGITPTPGALVSLVVVACLLATGPARADEAGPLPETVRFNRDVRPILSDACFKCHGFDPKERKAGLRLDTREGAIAALDGGAHPITPGDANKSEVYRRLVTDDADELMPPPKSGKTLTPRQKAIVKRWIEQGAAYEAHWSFVPPQRPELPPVKNEKWAKNPVDRFILARLDREGLSPSPEADRVTLVRRVTLDLTGLPPTPAEVDAFVADRSPDAYERLVDRLLSSPRYGERMAVDWLDAARFADTHGFHIDAGRDMTRWRDWTIDAFAKNKPYDAFVVEQLAGDLLPNATLDQRIASGFNRNHMINFEGGADPDEYHTAYVMDRVNTTSTVFLGLTVACAQCHDHKYDPVTQKDFYSLYAFFNNVPENGLDGRKGNAAPMLRLATPAQEKKLEQLASDVKRIEAKPKGADVSAAQLAWEKSVSDPANRPTWTALEPTEVRSAGGATLTRRPDRSIVAEGANPPRDTYTITAPVKLGQITAIRIEAMPDDALAARGPGRSGNGNVVLTDVGATVGGAAVKLVGASADFSQDKFPVAHAIDANPQTGWAIYPKVGEPHEAVFELATPTPVESETSLTVTLHFQSPFSQHQLGRFRVSVTDAKRPAAATRVPPEVAAVLSIEPAKRNAKQKKAVREYFLTNVSPDARELTDDLAAAKNSLADFEAAVPTTMVMAEMERPRDTFMLVRGEFDKKGERVTAATPSFLPPLPASSAGEPPPGSPRWLVDPSHPLTSRVAINRYWQAFFGTGIVKTADDFGSQGELPTHPELLDWLATEFVALNWDVRDRASLVTSAAYRQSSVVTPARCSPATRRTASTPAARGSACRRNSSVTARSPPPDCSTVASARGVSPTSRPGCGRN